MHNHSRRHPRSPGDNCSECSRDHCQHPAGLAPDFFTVGMELCGQSFAVIWNPGEAEKAIDAVARFVRQDLIGVKSAELMMGEIMRVEARYGQ